MLTSNLLTGETDVVDAGRGMGERVAADAVRTGARAVGVAVVLALTLAVAVAEAPGAVKPPRGETPPEATRLQGYQGVWRGWPHPSPKYAGAFSSLKWSNLHKKGSEHGE